MTLIVDSLEGQRRGDTLTYMPQRPKSFKISDVRVLPAERTSQIKISRAAAVPSHFTAQVTLANPDARLELDVVVDDGGFPQVQKITIWASTRTAITSTLLRQVLIDQILRVVIAEASVAITDRSDVLPGSFSVEGAPQTIWLNSQADDRVRLVADLYNQALAAGSRSPAVDVAEAVHVSRSQIARYIRKAREAGWILPLSEEVASLPPRYVEDDRRFEDKEEATIMIGGVPVSYKRRGPVDEEETDDGE